MVIRILTSVSLLLLGYYIGREVGRAEPIRRQLRDNDATIDNKNVKVVELRIDKKQNLQKL